MGLRGTEMSDEKDEGPTEEQKTAEHHIKGVEEAGSKGLITRRQADRLIDVGNKAHKGLDLYRGIRDTS
jgi:hypothetical protein